MGLPKSVVRFNKNGVQYISSCDRAQYTIRELSRAALRDVGKFIVRRCNDAAMELHGLKKSKRVRGKTSIFEYWARKQECDLQVGMGNIKKGTSGDTWYGIKQELGTSKMPKLGILRNTTYDNIAEIVKIESQYLSALEDEAKALSLIDEDEYQGGADD